MNYKDLVLDIIKRHVPECKVYLFGSRARRSHREGSDIDIALDANALIDHTKMVSIRSDIEESSLPVFVDVVDIHAASEEMKNQIKKDGVEWKR